MMQPSALDSLLNYPTLIRLNSDATLGSVCLPNLFVFTFLGYFLQKVVICYYRHVVLFGVVNECMMHKIILLI